MSRKWIIIGVLVILGWIFIFFLNKYEISWRNQDEKILVENNKIGLGSSIRVTYKNSLFSFGKKDVYVTVKIKNKCVDFKTNVKSKKDRLDKSNYRLVFKDDIIKIEFIDDGCQNGRVFTFNLNDYEAD